VKFHSALASAASLAAFSSSCFFFLAMAKSLAACFLAASFLAFSAFFIAALASASSFSFRFCSSLAAFAAALFYISSSQAFGYGTIFLCSMKILTSSSVTLALASWKFFNHSHRTLIKMALTSPVRSSPLPYLALMSSSSSSSSRKNLRY